MTDRSESGLHKMADVPVVAIRVPAAPTREATELASQGN
jgi:hypothetical protein